MNALLPLAVLVGSFAPLQALLTARLGGQVGGPLWGAALAYVIGLAAVLAVAISVRDPAAMSPRTLAQVPWWAWLGGLMNAAYLVFVVIAAPRIGTGTMLALVIFGQLAAAMALEHFGVLQPVRSVDLTRMAGLGMLVVGAVFAVKPWDHVTG